MTYEVKHLNVEKVQYFYGKVHNHMVYYSPPQSLYLKSINASFISINYFPKNNILKEKTSEGPTVIQILTNARYFSEMEFL